MVLQNRLPFLPPDAEIINDHLAVTHDDERITFFDAFGPIYTFRVEDEVARRLAGAVLTELKLVTPSQIGEVIGRHRSRVHEYLKRYREGGAEALEKKLPGPRGASKLKGTVLDSAQKFLDQGKSNCEVQNS